VLLLGRTATGVGMFLRYFTQQMTLTQPQNYATVVTLLFALSSASLLRQLHKPGLMNDLILAICIQYAMAGQLQSNNDKHEQLRNKD